LKLTQGEIKMNELEKKTEKEMNRREFIYLFGGYTASVALAITTGFLFSEPDPNYRKFTLKVGEGVHSFQHGSVRYSGMPNPDSFILSGNHYPLKNEEVKVGCFKYKVLELTPEEIRLEYIKK
jgi:hypothetical protein